MTTHVPLVTTRRALAQCATAVVQLRLLIAVAALLLGS
jgi:hypothetical protein